MENNPLDRGKYEEWLAKARARNFDDNELLASMDNYLLGLMIPTNEWGQLQRWKQMLEKDQYIRSTKELLDDWQEFGRWKQAAWWQRLFWRRS